MHRIVPLLSALLLSACAPRDDGPTIEASDGWARATAPGQLSAAVYARIVNRGPDDRLVAATSDRAAMAMIHDNQAEGGVARMRMHEALPLKRGETVALAPGGKHVMLSPLARPLLAGETFTLTLRFDHAPALTLPVTVVAPGSR